MGVRPIVVTALPPIPGLSFAALISNKFQSPGPSISNPKKHRQTGTLQAHQGESRQEAWTEDRPNDWIGREQSRKEETRGREAGGKEASAERARREKVGRENIGGEERRGEDADGKEARKECSI